MKLDKAAVTAGLAVLRKDLKDTAKSSGDLSGSLDSAAKSAAGAGGGFASMGTPMAGAIAAGVALSPVLVTLGAGLGGLALGAAGTLSPLLKAAGAAGGLQKNLAKLDPEQQAAGRSLLDLQDAYHGFEKALAPVVLQDFSIALGDAKGLMHALLPVSLATGKALGTFLGEFGATLQDPQWQAFWGFMAQTAPADMAMVGKSVIDLTNVLPPLLTDLQGMATVTLQLADDLARMTGGIVRARDLSVSWQAAQEKSTKSTNVASQAWHGFASLIGNMGTTLTDTGKWIIGMGVSSDKAAGSTAGLGIALGHSALATNAFGIKLLAAATNVTALTKAESASLDVQLAYSGLLITTANDAATLKGALKLSHGEIGLHTAAQRSSFAAANAYVQDLENAAKQAVASGKGAAGAAKAISDGLPILESAKTKNKAYWQEIRTLVQWLDRLRRMKAIAESIKITGTGRWFATAGELPGQPGMHALGRAAGWRVPGGFGGGDVVPALLEPGETVVPKYLTGMIAPLMKAYGVPGFAAGGIIPAFSGTVPGLRGWAAHNVTAALASIANSIGDALAHSFASAGGGAFGGAVPSGSLQKIAMSMLQAWGWGGQWGAFNNLEMAEAGWNIHATNPTSGAYGLPQALPPGKMATAGADWRTSGVTQLRWMMGYIRDTYGSPARAWAHEMTAHWYDQGGPINEPILGIGASGRPYGFQAGETVVPRGGARSGPLISFGGDLVVREQADINLLMQKAGFLITAAGL